MAELKQASPPYVERKNTIGGVNDRRGLLSWMDVF